MTPAPSWIRVEDALPDDEILVQIALNDDDVWTGFRDGGAWRYADAMPIFVERVTHWAPLLVHPALADITSRASAPTRNA